MGTVRYQLTRDELLATAVRRKLFKRSTVVLDAILVASGLVLVTLPSPQPAYAPVLGRFVLVLVPLLYALRYLVIRRLVARLTWLTQPTTLEFGPDGLGFAAGDIRSQVGARAAGDRSTRQDEAGSRRSHRLP